MRFQSVVCCSVGGTLLRRHLSCGTQGRRIMQAAAGDLGMRVNPVNMTCNANTLAGMSCKLKREFDADKGHGDLIQKRDRAATPASFIPLCIKLLGPKATYTSKERCNNITCFLIWFIDCISAPRLVTSLRRQQAVV
jgi:hypothetical protein